MCFPAAIQEPCGLNTTSGLTHLHDCITDDITISSSLLRGGLDPASTGSGLSELHLPLPASVKVLQAVTALQELGAAE